MRLRDFLQSFTLWAIVLLAAVMIAARRSFRPADWQVFIFLLAISGLGALLIGAIHTKRMWSAAMMGGLIGVLAPVLIGLVATSVVKGFEAPAAVFIGSLMLTVPSCLSGIAASLVLHKQRAANR